MHGIKMAMLFIHGMVNLKLNTLVIKNGNKSHWEQLNEKGKYSWIKTPLWRGKMAEVGPLARYIIIYTKVKQNLLQPNWAEKMMVESSRCYF